MSARGGVGGKLEHLLSEQAAYYCERAGEYDDWWLRRARFDGGARENAVWFGEVAELEARLRAFAPAGEVLELACGTGLWTQRLLEHAERVTAVDGSSEMIKECQHRIRDPRVSYTQADLFSWSPERAHAYDVCFFSFWLSHVPEERFVAFWERVRRSLAPGGRAFFIDSARSELAHSAGVALDGDVMVRRLADGRTYRIVKRFYEPEGLRRRLHRLGWECEVWATSRYFICGQARPLDG